MGGINTMNTISRKISDRNLSIEQIRQKYFSDKTTQEEINAQHLLHLAECEQYRRDNGEYNGVSATFKQNGINRIKHYIELRTEAEKQMPEYKIFIDSMEKSLAILSK